MRTKVVCVRCGKENQGYGHKDKCEEKDSQPQAIYYVVNMILEMYPTSDSTAVWESTLNQFRDFGICPKCFRELEWTRVSDAAGSMEWDYAGCKYCTDSKKGMTLRTPQSDYYKPKEREPLVP